MFFFSVHFSGLPEGNRQIPSTSFMLLVNDVRWLPVILHFSVFFSSYSSSHATFMIEGFVLYIDLLRLFGLPWVAH